MSKRIAVVNITGNVGKTTIAANVLAPSMPDAKFVAVETINAAGDALGHDVEKFKGRDFAQVYAELAVASDLILDVGASNVEEFMRGLTKFEDGHDEIDIFVIPVTAGKKEATESMKTVEMLAAAGVPAEKIRLIFNRVEESVEEEFGPVLNYVKKNKNCLANPECAIYESEIYDLMAARKQSLEQAMESTANFKEELAAARAADDKKAFAKATDAMTINKQAKSALRQSKAVFEILTAEA